MSGYDAASIVAQMAGLSGPAPAAARLNPEQLVARYCTRPGGGLVDLPGHPGVQHASGFCGIGLERGAGYEDGYDFIGSLTGSRADGGWQAIHEKGEWPYLIYMWWRAGDGERHAIAEYCEADLTVWTFDTPALAQTWVAGLKDAP